MLTVTAASFHDYSTKHGLLQVLEVRPSNGAGCSLKISGRSLLFRKKSKLTKFQCFSKHRRKIKSGVSLSKILPQTIKE